MTLPVSDIFYFDCFHLRADDGLLYRGGKLVPLEPRAASVLLYLVVNRERLVSKDELLETVWRDVFTTDDVLKKAVSQARRALADDAENPRFVQTLHRRGYRFIAAVSDASPDLKLLPKQQFQTEKAASTDPDFDQLVGRNTEMEFLRSEFRSSLRGRGQPVLIAGEPGIGKTQLTRHFQHWASGQAAICVRARFFDYEAAHLSSYDLFLGLLAEALGKSTAENPEKIDLRGQIQERFGVALPDELFAATANTERYQEQSDAFRMIAPLGESFLKLSRTRPLVVVLDDLQWADDTSLKIIGYLMRAADDAPLMFVALARRAEIETPAHPVAEWLRAQAVYRSYTTLKLSPLSQEDYRSLINEIFNRKIDETKIPPADLNKLYRTTGGNPYFLAETLRLLINEGVIEKAGTSDSSFWHWRGLRDVPLPETIRMAAQAKLERLSVKTREYVECAAVLGDAFQIETLEEMFGAGEDESEACLGEAVAAQVLTERDVSGADDCQFYHTTLRHAVYGDLSPRRRKRLHARAARAIETVYAENPDRVINALGVHYEAAGDAAASFTTNLRACEAANVRFDWTEAAEALARAERAAGFLNKDDAHLSVENRLRLLIAKGKASIGSRAEAEIILGEAAALAEKTTNRNALADARGIQAHTQVLLGRYRESLVTSQEALDLSRELGNKQGIANALLQIASAQYSLGEYKDASRVLQNVIEDYGAESYYTAVAFGKLGWVYALQSRYREAKNLLEKSLAFHKGAGDVRQRVVLALCLDWAEYGAGNYEAAIAFAAKARDEARNLGEPYSEAVALMRIGKSRAAQGLYEESEDFLNASTAKLAGLNSRHAEAETLWIIGRVRAATGRRKEAEKIFQNALETVCAVGDREDEFRILIDIAALKNVEGDAKNALSIAREAARIAGEIKVSDGVGSALVEQSVALSSIGKSAEAIQTASRAAAILDKAESGERWRAYFALSNAISAQVGKSENKIPDSERALRRSLELLEEIRTQFSESDADGRARFTLAHQNPARSLQLLLTAENRLKEAAEISRAWLLDS